MAFFLYLFCICIFQYFVIFIHKRHPTIVHLVVRIENGQHLYLTIENAGIRTLSPPQTTLTAFFTLIMGAMLARPYFTLKC